MFQEAAFPGDVRWPLESPFAPRGSLRAHLRNSSSEWVGVVRSLSQTASYMQSVTHLKRKAATLSIQLQHCETTFII